METNQVLAIGRKPKRKPRRQHFTIDDKIKQSPAMAYKYFNGYTVFSDGSIFNPWGWLLALQAQKGIPRYSFKINKKQVSISAATIVAELFVPNPNHYGYIGFKDGDVKNFSSENIEWIESKTFNQLNKKRRATYEDRIRAIVEAEKVKDQSSLVAKFEGFTVLSNGIIINKVAKLVNDYNAKHKKGLCGVILNLKRHQLKTLVATLFIPNPHNYTHVEQINNNPKDCDYKNLRWVPQSSIIKPTRVNLSGSEKKDDAIRRMLKECPTLQYKSFGDYVVFDNGVFIGKNGKILKPSLYQRKTSKVTNHEMPLWHNGKQRCWRTSIIVATCFIDNPDQHRYVAFKDGNILNVAASNLYWTSFKKPVPKKDLEQEDIKSIISKIERRKLSDGEIAIYDFLSGNEAAIITFLYPLKDTFYGWIIKRAGRNADFVARLSWDRAHDLFFEAIERVEDFIKKGKLLPAYGKPTERLYSYIYFELMQRMGIAYKRSKMEILVGEWHHQ